jgi:RNA polymerase primary sigma factor
MSKRMLAAEAVAELQNAALAVGEVLQRLAQRLLGEDLRGTLDEVGRTFNVTRERIRQIENQSLKKLQSLAEAQKLRDVA